MATWKSWIMAARPKTLTAAIAPIVVATSLAKVESGSWLWWVSALALLASLFIQIGTNLVNDAVDFKKGADTEKRIGPQRVTQAGIFQAGQVMWMGTFSFALAVLCGVPLVLQGGAPIVIVGLLSVLMGYAYTSGPVPLAYNGLGDLFVILFFGLIAVGGVYFLHTGNYPISAIVAGLQVGLTCTVLIAINNLRDMEGDRMVKKMTLPARFGKKFGRMEIAFLVLTPFVLGLYWGSVGHWPAFFVPLLLLPLGVKIVKLVFKTEPSPAYNKFLGMAAGLHMLFGVLLSIGFFL